MAKLPSLHEVICRWQYPHTYISLVLSSIPDGVMAWPLALISAQPTQAALALAPCLAQSHVS